MPSNSARKSSTAPTVPQEAPARPATHEAGHRNDYGRLGPASFPPRPAGHPSPLLVTNRERVPTATSAAWTHPSRVALVVHYQDDAYPRQTHTAPAANKSDISVDSVNTLLAGQTHPQGPPARHKRAHRWPLLRIPRVMLFPLPRPMNRCRSPTAHPDRTGTRNA